jgi:hypothetical protein
MLGVLTSEAVVNSFEVAVSEEQGCLFGVGVDLFVVWLSVEEL